MQLNPLHAPVVHVGDEQLVLGRAREGMNPVELPGATSRLADPPENLAVQRHLVDPSGLLVRRVEILRGRVGDADGPRLCLIGTGRGQISEHRVPLLVVGPVDVNEAKELAVAVEDLDAAVVAVGNVDVVLPIDAEVVGRVELRRVLIGQRSAGAG